MSEIKFTSYGSITAIAALEDGEVIIGDENMEEALVLDKDGVRNLIIALQRIATEME